MNLSPEFAEVMARIQQQCILAARREYESFVQEAKSQLAHANSQLAHASDIIEQRDKDNLELQQSLTTKVHEVCLNMYICTCDP